MLTTRIIIFICITNTMGNTYYENLHIFVNRFNVNHTILIILTLQTLGNEWFLTKVSVDERRLVDYFQTNASEAREALLWYRTTSLKQTLNFYGIFTEKHLPYEECLYHVSRAYFFASGQYNVSALISTIGLSAGELKATSYTYIDFAEYLHCVPRFFLPQCHNHNKPLYYETNDIVVLRAMFHRRCPMDNFIQYYWTVHDSTGLHLLDFIGGTLRPELKIGRYKLKVRYQSPLNRLIMVRLNARVVGLRSPLVERCYIALAPQRLYAVIRGGPYRKVFRGSKICIDGTPSRDLSLPRNAKQQLLYEWTCDSTKNVDKVCKLNMGTGASFTIPPYFQGKEQTVKFVLHLRSTYDYLRSAVAVQTILFSSFQRRYIDIKIVCVTNCRGNKFINKFPIHLKAQCLSCDTKKVTKWAWTVNKKLVGSSKRLILKAKIKSSITIYLYMEAAHRFKHTAMYHGTSTIHLERNLGPLNSKCYIKPLDGEALKTIFYIKCENRHALYKPLKYCASITGLLISECQTDELFTSRLPATNSLDIRICDNLGACIVVNVIVNVRPYHIEDTENAVINQIERVRYWLGYADWPKSHILLDQLVRHITSKERLVVFTEALRLYQPQTAVQLSHIVRLLANLVEFLDPLDDMKVSILSRILHIIQSSFKVIIASNELITLNNEYYEPMVKDLSNVLNQFCAEWEYIPKSHCRAESESCLNVDRFQNRLEQMSTLKPQGLEHINNWLHAQWKLSICLFYMGMGTATRQYPGEKPKIVMRNSFAMRMESFDIDNEQDLVIDSEDAMHTLIFTNKLLQELRKYLRNNEVLISVRSHKQNPYWWYPEQESRTQVLVVNVYTSRTILEKTKRLTEPFQYISKLKTDFSTNRSRFSNNHYTRRQRQDIIDFDDPEEDVENVVYDNVISPKEIRMYRTELYGHSVLGVTFTKADINFRVLLHMTNAPQLTDIDNKNITCLVKSGIQDTTALLLRNLCDKARPVYIYISADNPSEDWDTFHKAGAFYTFSTEIRNCRIWKYARPEPTWETISCLPEMNKSTSFGVHCRCHYISDLDADVKPIVAVAMNLKCHLERPVVKRNYQIIICYVVIPLAVIAILFIQMYIAVPRWDQRLFLGDLYSGKLCSGGDLVVTITFGGRYNSGSSANIILSIKSLQGEKRIIVYQDPTRRVFQRNSTILFRIQRELIQIPVTLALGHDNSGTCPDYFCRCVVITDLVTDQSQHFRFDRWIRASPVLETYKQSTMLICAHSTPKEIYKWSSRFAFAFELCMAKLYLFQSLIGPWRFGLHRRSHCRWERSCIYMSKIFSSACAVIIYFGRAEPIVCDPSPKRFNDIYILIMLCFICLIVSSIVDVAMNLFIILLSKYD